MFRLPILSETYFKMGWKTIFENQEGTKIILTLIKNPNICQNELMNLLKINKIKQRGNFSERKLKKLIEEKFIESKKNKIDGRPNFYNVNLKGFIDYICLNFLKINKFENELPFIEKCLKNFLFDEIQYNKLLESEQEPTIILSLFGMMESFISQIGEFCDNMLHNANFTYLYKKNLINDDEYNFSLNCYLYFAEKYKKKDSVRDSIIEIMPEEDLFN